MEGKKYWVWDNLLLWKLGGTDQPLRDWEST